MLIRRDQALSALGIGVGERFAVLHVANHPDNNGLVFGEVLFDLIQRHPAHCRGWQTECAQHFRHRASIHAVSVGWNLTPDAVDIPDKPIIRVV